MNEKTNLLTNDGYFGRYWDLLNDGKTMTEAWEAVEAELVEQTGLKRFVSMASFRDGLRNQRKRNVGKKTQKMIFVLES
jgi:hypothetical protein